MPEERCPLNPSMYKRYCSHCQGTAQGTSENPRFSIEESFYNGNPVVEVLRNGGQVHSYDRHFRFGCIKARMLLAALPALREFWRAGDEERLQFRPRVLADAKLGLTVEIAVTMNPDFVLSTGEFVDRCWLDIRALPSLETHKGVGVMKCRAICEVEDELRAWLKRHCREIKTVSLSQL